MPERVYKESAIPDVVSIDSVEESVKKIPAKRLNFFKSPCFQEEVG
jgi:hypothetical protein